MAEGKQVNTTYHDELSRIMSGMNQEDLIVRIKMCEQVVDKLKGDPVWQTVLKDAQMWVERLDAKWQDIYDEKSLANVRVLKLAYRHLVELPAKYKEDLKAAQEALDRLRNVDSSVQRDYDLETTVEAT